MKKQAKELKQGQTIFLSGEKLKIEKIEISDIGKQGRRKVRIEALKSDNQKAVIIRPDNYPIEVLNEK